MDKLWLIIKREYLSRVTKKTFILATVLTPIGIGLLTLLAGYLTTSGMNSEKTVAIYDSSGIITEGDIKSSSTTYVFPEGSLEELKETYGDKGYDVLVHIPPIKDLNETELNVDFYAKEKLSLIALEKLENNISKALKDYKIKNSGIDISRIEALEVNVKMENALSGTDGADGAQGDSSSRLAIAISTAISYIMGFLMYMVIFLYGSMVMRSVMEEKISRIVEVMISTVKPIQLMLGKIIGVGLVGLTQLAVWLILIPVILFGISIFFGIDSAGSTQAQEATELLKEIDAQSGGNMIAEVINELKNMNWLLIIPSFIVFFFGGYFIYSSLFAAVGSAMGDDLGEGQQMMLPITIPVILAFVMIPSVFNDPDGSLAIFGSMFPLLSPILMPARLPFDPPIWQVIVSILILIVSIVGVAWLAGRIYRTGILLYGKKVTFKELSKWVFYK